MVTGFLFFCIGLAAAFWKKREGILHVCFTYGAIAAGLTLTMVRIWPTWGWWSLSLAVLMGLAALLIHKFVKSNRVYWQEVAAYIIVFGPITNYDDMKILKDGRYQIAGMIGFFVIALLFNLGNPEPTLSSMNIVSKISAGIAAALLLVFLVRTWIIRK